jgi:hypothetical protein
VTIPENIKSLLEKKKELTILSAELMARFGPNGTYSLRREMLVARLSEEYREKLLNESPDSKPPTETRIKNHVFMHKNYQKLVEITEESMVELAKVTAEIDDIDYRLKYELMNLAASEKE